MTHPTGRFRLLLLLLAMLFCSAGCFFDQHNYKNDFPDSDADLLVSYEPTLDIESLFSKGGEIEKVNTKYSILYGDGNQRQMYVFSLPVREFAQNTYSLFRRNLVAADNGTYTTANSQFQTEFAPEAITIRYGSEQLAVLLNAEKQQLPTLNDTAPDTVHYVLDDNQLSAASSYNGIRLDYDISEKCKNFRIPLELSRYDYENDDAGYVQVLQNDMKKFMIYTTVIRDANDQLYPCNSVKILKIYPASRDQGRNMLLKITDPRLLETTGGIVQGMSGSPIIQDGKLVGAVTHVCVT